MNIINKIESLLLKEYKTIPFHNIFMLNNIENQDLSLGGTCSDKVLHFKQVLANHKIKTKLHSSFINGIECHRMLRIVIDNQIYFIDVGSGWPIQKLIPAFTPIEYSVYGMSFKTEIFDSEIILYHKSRQAHKRMITIPKKVKSEKAILLDIKNRYTNTSIYPFQNSLRFSLVKDNSFYFLKENSLRIFNENGLKESVINSNQFRQLLQNELGFWPDRLSVLL